MYFVFTMMVYSIISLWCFISSICLHVGLTHVLFFYIFIFPNSVCASEVTERVVCKLPDNVIILHVTEYNITKMFSNNDSFHYWLHEGI